MEGTTLRRIFWRRRSGRGDETGALGTGGDIGEAAVGPEKVFGFTSRGNEEDCCWVGNGLEVLVLGVG